MATDTVAKEIIDKINAGIQERFTSAIVYNHTFASAGTLNLSYGVTVQKLVFKNTSATNSILFNFDGGAYNYTLNAGESVEVALDHTNIYVTGVNTDTFCLVGVY